MPHRKLTQHEEFRRLFISLRRSTKVNGKPMSQEKLAAQLKLSREAIAYTETGRSTPSAEFMLKAFSFFQSVDLLKKYAMIKEDRKDLMTLANNVVGTDVSSAKFIMKKIIRESLKVKDYQTIFFCLFQTIMWDLEHKGKVNAQKINCLISATSNLDPDPNVFIDLTDKLYYLSKDTKSYDAFLTITEAIRDRVQLDNRRLSYLLGHQANAYYFSSDKHTAYKKTTKAIDLMGSEIYKHSHLIFHRHALICMQNENYDEAMQYELKCLSMLNETDPFYKIVKANIARLYYLREKYDEAKTLWEELFKQLGPNDPERTHSLNDMVMMELKLNNPDKARSHVMECDRLLKLDENEKWEYYETEYLLLRRGMVLLQAVESGNFVNPDVGKILQELRDYYLHDEYQLTSNFILQRTFFVS